MERTTPVRKSHTSTADLLTWTENPPQGDPAAESSAPRSGMRLQPTGGIRSVLFGGEMTEEEADSLLKRKPCSGSKLKEMTGSGIFAANDDSGSFETDGTISTPSNWRLYQQATSAISQISFNAEEDISPKKPTTLTEVAKQRELSGTLESESDSRFNKQLSDAKCKELSGHDIFGPPPEILPRPLASRILEEESKDTGEPMQRVTHTSERAPNPAAAQSNMMIGEEPVMRTARKIYDQKFSELSGNDIFKGDAPPSSAEKPLSVAKLREMSGNDIFADGKVTAREYYGGVRKPPGGDSSIALV